MSIIDNIKGLFVKNDIVKTMPSAKERRKIILDLQRINAAMTRQDIGAWRSAWQAAVNIDNPNRRKLYQIYRDVDVDLHLSGCIAQRTNYTLSRSFKLIDKKTKKENPEATELLETEWFKDLVRYSLQSVYWGHSLIELGEPITNEDGKPMYRGVTLIPRTHVVPYYGRVIKKETDDWKTGIDYHEAPFCNWLIEVGHPNDLGLYLKAATQTIPKKNDMAFWDAFAEIFGMPLRIAKTSTRDEKERQTLEDSMDSLGSKQWAIVSDGTEIDFIEASRGDAYNVYDRRIELADKELSKLVIGQTMTIEDGASLSQSETHLKVFLNIVESDCDRIRDMVNNQLLPLMVMHGFPVNGLRFEWDYSVDYTPEQQVAYETMIADRYEVDPKYFAEKYNMPVGAPKQGGGLMSKEQYGFFV